MANQTQRVLTISELNRMARMALEKALPSCWISGELSNFTRAASGHWYFTLKDASASARCVMFRPRNQFVEWPIREGEHIEIRAQASLFEPRGDFQLVVEALRKAGQGNLFEDFVRLKEKLQQEGLFDVERKRPLPTFPQCIGVITSPQAAALSDVLTTLGRCWPHAKVIIYPSQVQGEVAPTHVQAAITSANQRGETDVLLLVRGGGSLEDLWAFNQESVARTIAASSIPILTGIGHETDFTIADFAADARAPTPTGAAQMAVPDEAVWMQRISAQERRLVRSIRSQLESSWQRHDQLMRRLRHPRERLQLQKVGTTHLTLRLARTGKQLLVSSLSNLRRLHMRLLRERPSPTSRGDQLLDARRRLQQSLLHQSTHCRTQLHHLHTQLDLLCPELVLKRGYSIVRTDSGGIVISSRDVTEGQSLDIELATGHIGVTVTCPRF